MAAPELARYRSGKPYHGVLDRLARSVSRKAASDAVASCFKVVR